MRRRLRSREHSTSLGSFFRQTTVPAVCRGAHLVKRESSHRHHESLFTSPSATSGDLAVTRGTPCSHSRCPSLPRAGTESRTGRTRAPSVAWRSASPPPVRVLTARTACATGESRRRRATANPLARRPPCSPAYLRDGLDPLRWSADGVRRLKEAFGVHREEVAARRVRRALPYARRRSGVRRCSRSRVESRVQEPRGARENRTVTLPQCLRRRTWRTGSHTERRAAGETTREISQLPALHSTTIADTALTARPEHRRGHRPRGLCRDTGTWHHRTARGLGSNRSCGQFGGLRDMSGAKIYQGWRLAAVQYPLRGRNGCDLVQLLT